MGVDTLCLSRLVRIDLTAPSDALMAPQVDPIRTLILGATGRVTKAVIVDGRFSMRNGGVSGITLSEACSRA